MTDALSPTAARLALAAAGTAPPPAPTPATTADDRALRDSATAFEAAFLAGMFEAAGLGTAPGAFGGGAGEAQFASLLHEAQAQQIARAGGIGLADRIFEALKEESHVQSGN